jgi:hypothetical protein
MILGSIALLFFFARGYFGNIKEKLDKLAGSMEIMRKDLHDTREEMIIARSELKALWRTVDNAPKRASDNRGVHG